MASKSKTNEVSTVVFSGVKQLVNRRRTPWVGTMSDLMVVINNGRFATLPKTPSAMRVALNKVVNKLRNAGISIRFSRSTDHARTRLVRFSVVR